MSIDDAMSVAQKLLVQHNLVATGWTVGVCKGKRRLGLCNYRQRVIRISRDHIMKGTDEEVLDTIRHEVAHAIAGYGAKHGPIWQRVAIALGASPKPTTRVSYTHNYKYYLNCGMCNKVVQRRLNKVSRTRLIKLYCTNCGIKSLGSLTLTMASN